MKYPKNIRMMEKEKRTAWRKYTNGLAQMYKQNYISKDEYTKISKSYESVSDHKLKIVSNKIKREKISSMHKLVKKSKMFMNDIPVLTTENGEIFDSKSKVEQYRKNFGNAENKIKEINYNSETAYSLPEFEPYI
jgi:hypothetical protein